MALRPSLSLSARDEVTAKGCSMVEKFGTKDPYTKSKPAVRTNILVLSTSFLVYNYIAFITFKLVELRIIKVQN